MDNMISVECISKLKVGNNLIVGERYYIRSSSFYGDSDGDWYGNVYTQEMNFIGKFNLKHFKSIFD